MLKTFIIFITIDFNGKFNFKLWRSMSYVDFSINHCQQGLIKLAIFTCRGG